MAAASSSAATLSLQQVVALSADPSMRRHFSAMGAQPYLILTEDAAPLAAAAAEHLVRWLYSLPCPTLYVGERDDLVSRACDVRVATLPEARPLLATIEGAPLAAAVLVQLLRCTEQLPLEQALTAESLAYATLQAGPEFRRWLQQRHADPPAAVNEGPPVILQRSDAVLVLSLNRPQRRNAISIEMREALVEAFHLAVLDDEIEQIVLRGQGKCFSVGGDLAEFGTADDAATAHLVRSLALPARALLPCAPRLRCELHGACIGAGIEIPAFAHQVVATEAAFFQLPELRFGLIPGAGGCVSIPRRIGRQRTAWWVLSGRRISARTALAWGLIDAIV